MAGITRFSVSLDEDLLAKFDRQIREEHCPTRSKAVADLARRPKSTKGVRHAWLTMAATGKEVREGEWLTVNGEEEWLMGVFSWCRRDITGIRNV